MSSNNTTPRRTEEDDFDNLAEGDDDIVPIEAPPQEEEKKASEPKGALTEEDDAETNKIIESFDPEQEMNYYGSKFNRIIVHVDMDAYYAQVEMKKHGIKEEEPMGVLQWKSLIALNYAAKARGIKR